MSREKIYGVLRDRVGEKKRWFVCEEQEKSRPTRFLVGFGWFDQE
jgi:hypothetical protein